MVPPEAVSLPLLKNVLPVGPPVFGLWLDSLVPGMGPRFGRRCVCVFLELSSQPLASAFKEGLGGLSGSKEPGPGGRRLWGSRRRV